MDRLLDVLLILALALNFYVLAVSRIRAVINAVAAQGVLLGLLPPLIHSRFDARTLLLTAAIGVLKGVVIPKLLYRAMRAADIQHEDRPAGDFMISLLLGALGAGLALVFSDTLPLSDKHEQQMLVPASLATVWTGFLMLTTRHKAIMQVLGYLLLENGVFLFGLLLLEAMPFLVEIGVLLDLFTGVFIMGIIIHHISREFTAISTENPMELRE
jgi:hydrogenase-4 component E